MRDIASGPHNSPLNDAVRMYGIALNPHALRRESLWLFRSIRQKLFKNGVSRASYHINMLASPWRIGRAANASITPAEGLNHLTSSNGYSAKA